MKIPPHIAITIISILCIQLLILIILLLLKSRNKRANILLVFVLVFFGLTAGNLAVFYALVLTDLEELIPYLRLELLYGLGPSLYLYTKCVTHPDYRIRKLEYLHFLPVLLELIYYRTPIFRNGAVSLLETPKDVYGLVFMIEQWVGVFSATIYMMLAIVLLIRYKKWLHSNYSNHNNKTLQWLYKPIIAFVSFWCLWFAIRLGDMFFYSGLYSDFYYYPMFILLSIISLWIGFQGYFRAQVESHGFMNNTIIMNNQTDDDNNYSAIINQLKGGLEKDKLYLDQDLNLTSLSKKIGIQSKFISKAINNQLKMNFHEFINRYRVDEFKKRIESKNAEKLTILGHAFESGFASKSTFNHIFKKYTKLTPKEYCKKADKTYLNNMSQNTSSDD